MSVEGHGPLFFPEQLEDDFEQLLAPPDKVDNGQDWLTVLMAETERRLGLGQGGLVAPRSWNTVSAEDDWPIDRLPAVLIMTGTADEQERDEQGIYSDLLNVEVAVIESAHTYRQARRNASRLGIAVRAAIVQHLPDFSPRVDGILAGRHGPTRLPLRNPERTDTIAAYMSVFHVVVPDTLADTVSVTTVPEDPYDPAPDDPQVATAEVIAPSDPPDDRVAITATIS